jgi:hypothetical protein
MNLPISKSFSVVLLVLIAFGGFLKISDSTSQSESTLSRREVPVLDLSVKTYTSTTEQASDPLVVPDQALLDTKDNQQIDGWDRRLKILGERAKPSAESLCVEVAAGMESFTKELAADGSTPSMEKIADIRLVADYRRVFPFPNPGEKVVVLQCRAIIQYSIKIEAETDFYLLIDSDSNTRVRWEPNNATARKLP